MIYIDSASCNVTLVITVFNEESRIERVIDYYNRFGKVLVIDNYSTDNTLSIIKNKNVEVLKKKNDGTIQTPEFFFYIKNVIKTDYFVLLSSSEFIPPLLMHFFFEIAKERKFGLVSCVVDSFTCGELIPLWGGRFKLIDRKIERFFSINDLDIKKIHIHSPFETINPNKKLIINRKNGLTISHLRDSDVVSLIKKHTGYASVEANQIISKGKKFSLLRLSYLSLKELLRFIQIQPKYWGLISIREIAARLIMHLSIYLMCREIQEKKDLVYSLKRSNDKWNELIDTNDGG